MVAVDRTGEIRVVLAAFGALGIDAHLLVQLESEGVLRLTGDHVEFVHPQQRVAFVAASAQERRTLHAAAAHALIEPRHSALRAEHLAAAAVGPDEEAAAAMAELPAVRVGRCVRIRQDDVEALIRRGYTGRNSNEQREISHPQ